MDNDPNQTNQLNASDQEPQDDPVFSSTDLTKTKARKDTHYFTHVQKATPWQKISEWFNKINRESLERSAARKAAFKAKLEERRRAADLAAISAAVPEIPTATDQPSASTGQPTDPAPTTPSQPAAAPGQAPTSPQAPVATPPQPPAAAPGQTPATEPTPTVILEDGANARPKSKRSTIILAIICAVLIIGAIIVLIVVHPWAS